MARTLNKLTAAGVKNAKPRSKLYRLSDGGGLVLTVQPSGSKHWHFRYRDEAGKSTMCSFGSAHVGEVSLLEARRERDRTRRDLRRGITPASARRERQAAQANTFKAVATQWYEQKARGWTNAKHKANIWNSLVNDVFPHIGSRLVPDITTMEVLNITRRIQQRGAWDTAERVLQRVQSILKFAVVIGASENNPAAGLSEYVNTPPEEKGHFPAVDYGDLGGLLKAVDTADCIRPLTKLALNIQMMTALRPGEVRHGRWDEVDWEACQWVIPAERMKMARGHIVPLSRQVEGLLKELHKLTGGGEWMFPAAGARKHPVMSENTVNDAISRVGFQGKHTAHGFRATFKTWASECKQFLPDAVERQLAHVEGNRTKAAYDRALHLEERKRLLQAWADYTDVCRDPSSQVVVLHRKQA